MKVSTNAGKALLVGETWWVSIQCVYHGLSFISKSDAVNKEPLVGQANGSFHLTSNRAEA